MKKKMIALLTGLILTLSAGSAFASFANLDLIRVVYNTSTGTNYEQAVNLGNITTLMTASDLTVGPAITGIGAGNTLSVAYFAINRTGTGLGQKDLLWVGATGTPTLTNVGNANNWNSLKITQDYYSGLSGSGSIANSDETNTSSYSSRFSQGGSNHGSFSGVFNATYREFTEMSLANLATAAIDMNVFAFANIKQGATVNPLADFVIRTDTDGNTIINPTAVPIPAAAWLLGSGLMGLVGIRRRMK
jgi:hypothetical protein